MVKTIPIAVSLMRTIHLAGGFLLMSMTVNMVAAFSSKPRPGIVDLPENLSLSISEFKAPNSSINMPDSIWDLAIAQQKQREITSPSSNSQKHKESSLLVVGSKGVGKTTLIQRLLERQEAAKPTLALEYTYGRRANQSLAKV